MKKELKGEREVGEGKQIISLLSKDTCIWSQKKSIMSIEREVKEIL